MRLLPVLLMVGGCAQVFGIDNTTGPDADPARVSVQMQRLAIGATIIKGPLDLSMQTASFYVDDGAGGFTTVAGEYQPPDTLSAPIPTGTPSVLFTLPDMPTPQRRLWQMPARNRLGNFGVFIHADPQPPAMASRLIFQGALPSPFIATESLRVEAIGAWGAHAVTTAEGAPMPGLGISNFTLTIPYNTFGRMVGNMPVTKITSADVVVLERYVGNQLTGVFQAPGFDQADGDNMISNANLSALTPNLPLMGAVAPATFGQRFSAVRPAVGTLASSWAVNASPGYTIGSGLGPLLAAGGVALPPTPDTMINAMFANPFESLGWKAVVSLTAVQSRSYTFSGIATGFNAVMYTVAEAGSNVTFDFTAGLPISLRINLMPLVTDGQTVALDLTKPVELDAQVDRPTNTLYTLSVYEVALSSDMMSVERKHIVDVATTGEPKFRLPPDLFTVDHHYYAVFRSMQGGYINAASGDLQTFSLPYSVSQADSALFKVTAP